MEQNEIDAVSFLNKNLSKIPKNIKETPYLREYQKLYDAYLEVQIKPNDTKEDVVFKEDRRNRIDEYNTALHQAAAEFVAVTNPELMTPNSNQYLNQLKERDLRIIKNYAFDLIEGKVAKHNIELFLPKDIVRQRSYLESSLANDQTPPYTSREFNKERALDPQFQPPPPRYDQVAHQTPLSYDYPHPSYDHVVPNETPPKYNFSPPSYAEANNQRRRSWPMRQLLKANEQVGELRKKLENS